MRTQRAQSTEGGEALEMAGQLPSLEVFEAEPGEIKYTSSIESRIDSVSISTIRWGTISAIAPYRVYERPSTHICLCSMPLIYIDDRTMDPRTRFDAHVRVSSNHLICVGCA